MFAGQGATRSGNALAGSFLIDLRERRGTGEKLLGLFLKRVNPILFGAFFIGIKIALMTSISFAKSERNPVAGFVDGAFVMLGIAEAFGEDGTVSVFVFEVIGKLAQGEPQAASGEVGLPPGFEHHESSELGDQGKAASSGERIPSDPFIAVLEPECCSRPAQNSAQYGVVFIGIGLVNPLPNGVSSGPPSFEVVLGIEGSAELVNFKFGVGLPDFEALADLIARRADIGGFHDTPNLALLGAKSSENGKTH